MDALTSGTDAVTSARKINKAGTLLLVILTALASLLLPMLVPAQGGALSVVAPQPAAAAVVSHDLTVENVGSKRFIVGTHWGYKRGVNPVQRKCVGNGSTTRLTWLQPGRSSANLLGSFADDIDCIVVPRGWSLKRDKAGPNTVYVKCSQTEDHEVARKVSPPPWTKRFYLKKC